MQAEEAALVLVRVRVGIVPVLLLPKKMERSLFGRYCCEKCCCVEKCYCGEKYCYDDSLCAKHSCGERY